MSTPSITMRPAVGRATPEITLNSVVFPAPFGPITPTMLPGATSRSTSFRMVAPPICRPRPSISSADGTGVLMRMRLVSGCRVAIYFFAGATCSAGTVSTSAGVKLPPLATSLTWYMSWMSAWSPARTVSAPFGPWNV